MDNDIILVVEKYKEVIHSYNKEDFYNLWSKNQQCSLISVTKKFIGIDDIYNDFLIGGIKRLYSNIDLISESMEINKINDSLVIVIFKYHTETISRETGEEGGIKGLETQVIIKEDHEWKLLHVHYSR